MASKVLLLLGAAVLFGLPLCAQNPQLATAISNNFTVNAGPPVTMSPSSGTYRTAAKAVHDYMVSQGYSGTTPVDTIVSGVDIRWGVGTVSWSQGQVIVLATEKNQFGASATVSGDESSAYAVVFQNSVTMAGYTGGAAAASDSGSNGGHARAFAGPGANGLVNPGNGGFAEAASIDGLAFAEGGQAANNGSGGGAEAMAGGYAYAYGGDAPGTGAGGAAMATSTASPAQAYGGESSSGNGGAATADGYSGAWAEAGASLGAGDGGIATASASATTLNANASAYGGGSNGGNGGAAYADAELNATASGGDTVGPGNGGYAEAISQAKQGVAYGGVTDGAGNGGAAYAESFQTTGLTQFQFWVYAEGGDTEEGDGGNAEARAVGGAWAVGGDATSTLDVGSWGGEAKAFSTDVFAKAESGDGNSQYQAYANSTNGDAHAIGGDGLGDGSTLTINGGYANATALNGTAEAEGGDSLATNPNLGGYAYANGSAAGWDDDQPTTWQGGYAFQN